MPAFPALVTPVGFSIVRGATVLALHLLPHPAFARASADVREEGRGQRRVSYFCGGPKSSGGRSIWGISILMLFGSMIDCSPL